MKTKTKTYLLLVAVLAIWGTVGYKILSATNPDTPELDTAISDTTFKPKTITKKDAFSIQTVERDPFLGTLTKKSRAKVKRIKPVNTENEVYPAITYHGVVKKQNASNQIFTVSINNQQHLLKKGQIIDDVKLISGNSKAIVVRYNSISKTISIQ